jgi:hypothetical protein
VNALSLRIFDPNSETTFPKVLGIFQCAGNAFVKGAMRFARVLVKNPQWQRHVVHVASMARIEGAGNAASRLTRESCDHTPIFLPSIPAGRPTMRLEFARLRPDA